MTSHVGLAAGALFAALTAVIMLIVPVAWLRDVLDIAGADATTAFLLRRYAASATAGLLIFTTATALQSDQKRAALLALATWFGVQATTAIAGIVSGDVGGLIWVAVFVDPLIAIWFIALSLVTSTRQMSST